MKLKHKLFIAIRCQETVEDNVQPMSCDIEFSPV